MKDRPLTQKIPLSVGAEALHARLRTWSDRTGAVLVASKHGSVVHGWLYRAPEVKVVGDHYVCTQDMTWGEWDTNLYRKA